MGVNIFLFHRDFRLEDHKPLQTALDKGEVLPLFIFNPVQVSSKAYVRSIKSIECMLQGLEELDEELSKKYKSRLCVMYGDTVECLRKIIVNLSEVVLNLSDVDSITETRDYTTFAKKRESEIRKYCDTNDIEFEAVDDIYLTVPGEVLTGSGKVYQKFTPFYEKAKHIPVPKPTGYVKGKFVSSSLVNKISNTTLGKMRSQIVKKETPTFYTGGRKEGLKLLASIPSDYDKTRDIMALETSGLSVHHHFGTVSIRESYWKGKNINEFVRQLYWRDFYGHMSAYFKELYGVEMLDFEKNWPKLSSTEQKKFDEWCRGETGIDIIDAAMNQLNTSGYMHNRARLLTASYLVKTLKVPWRFGERYFANHLLDYDVVQNCCNWMLVSSVKLPFTEPPYRKHTPESYARRFDPDGEYVEEWL